MNIYEKLQTIRCELQEMGLKKSGENKFAGYEYYELADFIPPINSLMKKHNVTSILRYEETKATLTLVNCETPEETIVFESPMAKAVLKGCHDVQNLGASETYIRRYLYVAAFEIVEADAVDSSVPVETITDEQMDKIVSLINDTDTDVEKFCKYMKVSSLVLIPQKDFQRAIKALEAKKVKNGSH